jgi:hypothetical protein
LRKLAFGRLVEQICVVRIQRKRCIKLLDGFVVFASELAQYLGLAGVIPFVPGCK